MISKLGRPYLLTRNVKILSSKSPGPAFNQVNPVLVFSILAHTLPPSNMVPCSSPPCPSPPQYYSPLTPPPSPEHQFSVMPTQVHSTYYMQPMLQPRIMAPVQPSEVTDYIN